MSVYGLTLFEETLFYGLIEWLCIQKGLDYTNFSNQEHRVKAEKKAIMDILLSLNDGYIYNHWSMGSQIRFLLKRVHDLGSLVLASTVTGQMSGTDMFTGEDVTTDSGVSGTGTAEVPGTATTSGLTSGIQVVHAKRYLFCVTASGPKDEYLGTVTSWAYHVLLNGAVHPATREPIQAFACKSLEHFNELPKALRLSRTERSALAAALVSERPEDSEVVPEDLDDFEQEYDIPDDRSFYLLHFQPAQSSAQQVAPALSNFFYDAEDMEDYFQSLLTGHNYGPNVLAPNQVPSLTNQGQTAYIYILHQQ